MTSDRLGYEIVEEGSSGFLGIGSKPAVIEAWIKEEEKPASLADVAKEFLKNVFDAMHMAENFLWSIIIPSYFLSLLLRSL